jgi:preprotein translocase SecE subunit
MENIQKYVTTTYLVVGLVFGWFFIRATGLAFASIKPSADMILFAGLHISAVIGAIIAVAVTMYSYRNERTQVFVTESISELTKVTWPKWEDTKRGTWVVIAFSVIIALLMACFDFFWKFFTDVFLTA